MEFTEADLETLKSALVSGVLSVQIGDRTVTYRSQKDLLVAIKIAQTQLQGVSTAVTPNTIQPTFKK